MTSQCNCRTRMSVLLAVLVLLCFRRRPSGEIMVLFGTTWWRPSKMADPQSLDSYTWYDVTCRSYPPTSDYRAPSRGDYASSGHDYAPPQREYGSRDYAPAPREFKTMTGFAGVPRDYVPVSSRGDYLPAETRDYGPPSRKVER